MNVRGPLLAALFALSTAAPGQTSVEPWKAPARAARKKNPVPADAASIVRGKLLYRPNCEGCHGTAGRGDGPVAKDLERAPGDLASPTVAAQSDGELFWKISEGRKPMPGFDEPLTEEERWHIVNYTRTLSSRSEESP